MADLLDLADDVAYCEAVGLHGLAMLARFRHSRAWSRGEPSPEILEYIDILADEFLSTISNGTSLREVIQKPELGLTRGSSGRPSTTSELEGIPNSIKQKKLMKQKAFRAALYREQLIRVEVVPTEADAITLKKFGYSEESVVRNANRNFRHEVKTYLDCDPIFVALQYPNSRKLISVESLRMSLIEDEAN